MSSETGHQSKKLRRGAPVVCVADLSPVFRQAVALSGTPYKVLARHGGVSRYWFGLWMSGARKALPGDRRVLAIARLLGVPEAEAFVTESPR